MDDAGFTIDLDPPVLSTGAPLLSAREMVQRRYMRPGARTIHHQQGAFFLWDGIRYVEAAPEEIRARIYEFLDSARRMNDDDKLVPFNPNKSKVANVLEALAAVAQLEGATRAPAWLAGTSHPLASDILACANGLLHLPTRTLLPHTPEFFGLNAVEYSYDATAGEPTAWMDFLASIWRDDPGSIDTLQELFGLLLTADTSHQKAFLIVGPKRSGKGTIARILTALLGKENVAGPTLSGLSQNFGLAPLIGKPLAVVSDARLGGRVDAHAIAERLLAITGEDSLSVDRKIRDAWTGQLPTRFVILTNELPRLTDASGALASRFLVFRLVKSFYGQEDLALTHNLLAELPAILRWAMDGRDRLAERGHFKQPESAGQEVEELADLGSPIGAFVRECCVIDPLYSQECSTMFEAWVTWCRENGRDHPGTTHLFGRDLRAAVASVQTQQKRDPTDNTKRYRAYAGIALIP